MPKPRRFILLPPLGVRLGSPGLRPARGARPLEQFLAAIALPQQTALRALAGAALKVLDSIHEDGAKLVEMRPEDVLRLRSARPGVRVVPEVFFRTARSSACSCIRSPVSGACSAGTCGSPRR